MYVMHPYAVPIGAHQGPTWQALRHSPLPVRHVACGDDTRYEAAVQAAWEDGEPFLICEHDIVPTPAMLTRLADCPEPYCAQAYVLVHDKRTLTRLHRIQADLRQHPADQDRWPHARDLDAYLKDFPRDPAIIGYHTLAHRVSQGLTWRWATLEDLYADYVGLGLAKITPHGPPQWEPGSWRDLDSRLSWWTHAHGIRWHLHGPLVPHFHVLEDA